MAHSEAKWPSQQNITIIFSYFIIFSSTCRHIFCRNVARKSSFGGFMFVQGTRHSEHLQWIHCTALTNCTN